MAEHVVITDASCLIVLDNIKALNLIQTIYKQVFTTPEIAAEFNKPLPEWLTVTAVKNKGLVSKYNEQVDLGEASAIALAQEMLDLLLIMDDLKGRRLANQLNIKFTGTIGVLITAR